MPNPLFSLGSRPGPFYNRRGEYTGQRPFGPVILKQRAAAAILGVRPKDLLRMNVKRAFYLGAYVYDPLEITALAASNKSTSPTYPNQGTTNNNVME